MKLYKNEFKLNGSYSQQKQISVPTNEEVAIQVKIDGIDDPTGIQLVNGDEVIEVAEIDGKNAIFVAKSGVDAEDDKTYSVKYHREGTPTKQLSYSETTATRTMAASVSISLENIITAGGPNFEDFDYAQYRYYFEKKVDGKDYTNWENANKTDVMDVAVTSMAIHSEDFPTYMSSDFSNFFMTYGDGEKKIYMWRINGKYGFIPLTTMVEKEGQPVSENDFLTGSISDWFDGNIPTQSRVISRQTLIQGNTYVNVKLYGKPIPAIDCSFNGITLNTTSSSVGDYTPKTMKIGNTTLNENELIALKALIQNEE